MFLAGGFLLWQRRWAAVVVLTLSLANLASLTNWSGEPGSYDLAWAQWTNRYPKVDGYSHHVYLEGFELPILAAGPTDPAPSPDGKSIAFAAYGWLWLLDLEYGNAIRLTNGPHVDSRPTWSADGSSLAFLRDDSSDLDIWALDMTVGEEKPLVETPAIELDPAFSSDGEFLYYSSAVEGDIDIWRLQIATSESMRLTSGPGLELRPLPLPSGDGMIYLRKARGGPNALVSTKWRSGGDESSVLMQESIVSQTHPAISPDGKTLAVNWPTDSGYELKLVDLNNPDELLLRSGAGLPLSPAFGLEASAGSSMRLYFVEANRDHQFELFSLPLTGGEAEPVEIRSWDWGEELGRLTVATRLAGELELTPVRVSVTRGDGHPMVGPDSIPRFDGTHGSVYFYSEGEFTMELPHGEYEISIAHGFATTPKKFMHRIETSPTNRVDVILEANDRPRERGWVAADHHYHMNYGGPYRLEPDTLQLGLRAEDMDIGTPLMANLHHRLNDLEFFDWKDEGRLPWLELGQEVRSHFLGHLGLVHVEKPFWPWFWGPGYPVYAQDDRPNADALRHATRSGGLSTYMHPVSIDDPFGDSDGLGAIPLSIIPDAVLGELDAIELVCLWTSELGTSELWYRFLNVGRPLAANGGTDAMVDYYRTMAVGTTRIYVQMDDEALSWDAYLKRLRAGRSFVTTGPLLELSVDGKGPGEVIDMSGPNRRRPVVVQLSSVVPVETLEILVNGRVVQEISDLEMPGPRSRHELELEIPSGGWVAARVHGGKETWPAMNGYPFAHSSPIWIGSIGSMDPDAASESARELLAALNQAESRLRRGYEGVDTPRLDGRMQQARRFLESLVIQ